MTLTHLFLLYQIFILTTFCYNLRKMFVFFLINTAIINLILTSKSILLSFNLFDESYISQSSLLISLFCPASPDIPAVFLAPVIGLG